MARILVADDEEGFRSFLAEALTDAGHDVSTAEDGQQALELLARLHFDLLITDLKMPRVDGTMLLRQVREDQPDVEVLVITAHGSVESAVQAIRLGAYDYLQKPLGSPQELNLVVGRALERRELLAYKDRARRTEERELMLTFGAPAMAPVVESLRKVARTNATVLLQGESGTGKEVAAHAVHRWSARAGGPFVAVNCAALPETLLESELFGHEKGAFTGAQAQRRGRLELASGGTFFLDEIGELKPEFQVKLLRVLQERRFERLGGSRTLEADVRWIAASNADLQAMVRDGSFREDLYHRLAVFPVRIPPLRERPEDIVPLARFLLEGIAADLGRPGLALDASACRRLETVHWSGNVRELHNVLERSAILAESAVVSGEDLPLELGAGAAPRQAGRLTDVERDTIAAVLAEVGGNRRRAAERLGIGLRTLYEKLSRYGMK